MSSVKQHVSPGLYINVLLQDKELISSIAIKMLHGQRPLPFEDEEIVFVK